MSKLVVATISSALRVEYLAVRAYLKHVASHRKGNDEYEVGAIDTPNGAALVAIAEYGMNNVNAAAKTSALLDEFRPTYALFVGIAGGLKDVRVGDVVAATKVYGVGSGKEADKFLPRPEIARSSYFLESCARVVARDNLWSKRLPAELRGSEAFLGAVASDEVVMNNPNGYRRQAITDAFSDALAVEMEGIGFMVGARPFEQVTLPMVVRGISDLTIAKETDEAANSQPIAATVAAAFAVELLVTAITARNDRGTIDAESVLMLLTGLLPQLYPEGPRDRAIWLRAGGDISRLTRANDARTEWFNALQDLRNGIAQITLPTLIATAKADYPLNPELGQLL